MAIVVGKIGTHCLDQDLSKFLNQYTKDGTDHEFGHCLVSKLDKSRPRVANGYPGSYAPFKFSIISHQATEDLGYAGIYRLSFQPVLPPGGWASWLEYHKSAATHDLSIENFIGMMNGNVPFGETCPNILMSTHGRPGLRPDLGIQQNPVAAADAAFRANCNLKDFQAPLAQLNSLGSVYPVQTVFASLTLTVYHHRGSAFKWIIVPPMEKLKLEAAIRQQFNEELADLECSQFVHHLCLWVTPDRLRMWNIVFFEVTQSAGGLLFIFPGAYFWGFSTGHNVLEWKYHAGEHWDCSHYNFCLLNNPLCHRANNGATPLYLEPVDNQNRPQNSATHQFMVPALKKRKRPQNSDVAIDPFSEMIDVSAPPSPLGTYTTSGQYVPFGKTASTGSTAADDPSSSVEAASKAAENLSKGLLQENQALGQANQDLAVEMRQSGPEREAALQHRLQEACLSRDYHYSLLSESAGTIDSLTTQASLSSPLEEQVQAANAERDRFCAMVLERDDTIKSLQEAAHIREQSVAAWRADALREYDRANELQELLQINNIDVPKKI